VLISLKNSSSETKQELEKAIHEIEQKLSHENKLHIQNWSSIVERYNKEFYEDLVQIPNEWKGYGGLDSYGLNICAYAKHIKLDFQQYRLNGQIVFEYSIGPLRTDEVHGFSNYYKNLLVRKDVSEQREEFNKNLPTFIEKKIKELYEQHIIASSSQK
jgi:hypothetical protein